MKLPGASDELAAAVIEANKNTAGKSSNNAFTHLDTHKLNAVVVQSGTPVEMPWAPKASTILQVFYGGNAVGYGVADVIFGKINPSSRLPLTFPIRLEDNPSYLNFGGENGKGVFA
jgi:beta-glucosidase